MEENVDGVDDGGEGEEENDGLDSASVAAYFFQNQTYQVNTVKFSCHNCCTKWTKYSQMQRQVPMIFLIPK